MNSSQTTKKRKGTLKVGLAQEEVCSEILMIRTWNLGQATSNLQVTHSNSNKATFS